MTFGGDTIVINLARRRDRRVETEHELARIGWSATFFPAIEPAEAGDFPSIGARGCFLSHLAVLKAARESAVARLIILEDDITFAPDFAIGWQSALLALASEPWSIFYPGHPLDGLMPGLSLLSPDTVVRGTHFMVINGEAIPQLIAGLETILSRPAGHPLGSPMHVDGAYSTIRAQNPTLKTFAYFPTLGRQRPSRTDVGAPRWFDRIDAIGPIVRLLRKGRLRLVRAMPGSASANRR